MARYSSTYSGDTSSWFAGKVMSAAGMARAESDAQEKDRQAGLDVANSGNLFGKALQSEFGGDLFSRTIGIFDTNRSAAQTDRASTKARRFAANFERTEKKKEEVEETKNEDVDRAVDDLLKDDDHIPVKDEKLRDYVTRVFGVGIDSKLVQLDQRVSKSVDILSDIKKVHQGSVNLMIDHNELIAGKLDRLLKLYNDQYNFQDTLKDRAQVARKENELEKEDPNASTRRYQPLPTSGVGSAILGGLSDVIGRKVGRKLWRRITGRKKPLTAISRRVGKKPLTAITKKPVKFSSVGKQIVKKFTTKAGAKAVSKGAKLIPGVGTVIALGEAAYRASKGDMTGAALSVLSAIPIVGWGVTAVDIGRDLGLNPLGLPPSPGNKPISYESGTSLLTSPGLAEAHGTERILAVDPDSGITTRHIKNIGDTLVSTSMHIAKDLGVQRDVHNKVSTLPFAVKNISYNTGIKTKRAKSLTTEKGILEQDMGIAGWLKKASSNEKTNVDFNEEDRKKKYWPIDPRGWGIFGGGGSHVQSDTAMVGKVGPKTITFADVQGIDASNDPGIDFSYGDYKKNYSLFDGEVMEIGLLYGQGYGNVVIVRSVDPTNGKSFDSLYSHFPDGGIAVKPGQKVRGGDYLGKVGFVSVTIPGVPELQPNNAGNMSGWHTSVDFFEPDSTAPYGNRAFIIDLLLNSEGKSPRGNNLFSRSTGEMDTNSEDFAVLTAISALEAGDAQSRADVAQSIYNRLGDDGKYGNSISQIIKTDAQYQPAYVDPNVSTGPGTKVDAVWKIVKNRESAITAMVSYWKKKGVVVTREEMGALWDSTAQAIQNQQLQIEAASHVGGHTEFFSGHSYEEGDKYRGRLGIDNTFFSRWGSNYGIPKEKQIDRGASPNPLLLNKPIGPQSSLSPELMPIFDRVNQNNKLTANSSLMESMEEESSGGVTVLLNNIVQSHNTQIGNTASAKTDSGFLPSLFKTAKLAG